MFDFSYFYYKIDNDFYMINYAHKMFIIGGEIYEDEEIFGFDPYYPSIYEQNPDDYIYEDEYDKLSFALQDKMQLRTVIVT
jgi:hypothetical protein